MTPDQIASLEIQRMIFHEVGGTEVTLLDTLIAAPAQIPFFLGRVKSVLRGSAYEFLADSPVPAQLRAGRASEEAFIRQSRDLASSFHAQHEGTANSKPGTFFVFSLTSTAGPLEAVLKFDRPESVAYKIEVNEEGKKTATFTDNPFSINEAKSGLQKAALFQEVDGTYAVWITDRSGRYKVSQYYEKFLGVHRRIEPSALTAALFDIAKKAALRNPADLAPEVAQTVNRHIFRAIQQLEGFDPETDDFENAAFGPTQADAKIRRDFHQFLQERAMSAEAFEFDRTAIPQPALIRLKTREGVELTYNTDAANYVTRNLNGPHGGTIVIRTQHVLDRDDDA